MLIFEFSDNTLTKEAKGLKAVIKTAASAVLKHLKLGGKYELSLTVCGDEEIRELNRLYRNKDKKTDVLSFPVSEEGEEINPDNNAVMLGDIVISLDTAKEQAAEYGNTLEREISFLTIHGMLHLLGFDHEISEDEEKIMFDKQKEIIKILFEEEA